MKRIGRSLLSDLAPPENLFFDPSNFSPLSPGRPKAYSTDELLAFQNVAATAMVVYPAPSATENALTVKLRVARLPLRSYTVDALESASEIPDDYAYDVLEWAAYRAKRNQDADALDITVASKHKEMFDDAVLRCKEELRTRLLSNTQFVFGTNAFSWTR